MRKRNKHVRILFSLFSGLVVILSLAASQVVHAASQTSYSYQYTKSENGQQQTVKVWITYYGYDDNDDNADIAYSKSDGYPTLHNVATEGTGTYTDPVTFAAADVDKNSGLFPVGSLMYAPFLRKYFIMEDQCGDSDPTGCAQDPHADLFMGPSSYSTWTPLKDCEDNSTQGDLPVVINPAADLAVDTTPMFHDDTCTIHDKYGNQVTTTGGTTNVGVTSPPPDNPPGNPGSQPSSCSSTSKTATPLWSGSVDAADWQTSWGVKANDPLTIGAANLASVSDPTGQLTAKVLQVSYPTNGTPPTNEEEKGITYGSQFLAQPDGKSYECLYLSYYVLFPRGFNFANGGKLPGLYGGGTVYGHTPPDGTNGFSVRLMWNGSGGGGVCAYLSAGSAIQGPSYHLDGSNTSIGLGRWHFAADGQWHHIEMQVELNNNSLAQLPNGSIQVWYDNKSVLSATGVKFRTPGTSQLEISGILFSTFYNSLRKGSTLTLPADAQVDFANFALGKQLIAPDSHIKQPSDPTSPDTQQPDTQPSGGGQYDLAIKIIAVPQSPATGTQTYQIQVSNLSGSVTQPIVMGLIVVGNTAPLQLTTTDSSNGWVIVRKSGDPAPSLGAAYTGREPGYPVPASTVLPTITVTFAGTINAGADLIAWVDVSGQSGDSDFNNNLVSQMLTPQK